MLMTKFATVQLYTLRFSEKSHWQMHMSKKVRSCFSLLKQIVHYVPESVFSLAALESKLVAYVKDTSAAERPFDVSSVPKISRVQAAQEAARKSPIKRA